MYPTQSTRRTFISAFSPSVTRAPFSGMNLGSVVMMVLPADDWGSSSVMRSFAKSAGAWGRISVSQNFLINVDLPVRTGPTTPM